MISSHQSFHSLPENLRSSFSVTPSICRQFYSATEQTETNELGVTSYVKIDLSNTDDLQKLGFETIALENGGYREVRAKEIAKKVQEIYLSICDDLNFILSKIPLENTEEEEFFEVEKNRLTRSYEEIVEGCKDLEGFDNLCNSEDAALQQLRGVQDRLDFLNMQIRRVKVRLKGGTSSPLHIRADLKTPPVLIKRRSSSEVGASNGELRERLGQLEEEENRLLEKKERLEKHSTILNNLFTSVMSLEMTRFYFSNIRLDYDCPNALFDRIKPVEGEKIYFIPKTFKYLAEGDGKRYSDFCEKGGNSPHRLQRFAIQRKDSTLEGYLDGRTGRLLTPDDFSPEDADSRIQFEMDGVDEAGREFVYSPLGTLRIPSSGSASSLDSAQPSPRTTPSHSERRALSPIGLLKRIAIGGLEFR